MRDLGAPRPRRRRVAVLGLLRACLEHRFGTDVAIGAAGSQPVADADDIAL
ncbi:MAG TPA: hypothetical protein VNV62_11165 [Trebonia sp.]|nr:hypothetical protein [Trebonia sp.]